MGQNDSMITSRQNPRVIRLAALKDKKYREADGLFLAYGVKLTSESLDAGAAKTVIISEDAASEATSDIVRRAEKDGVEVLYVSASVFEKISTESAPQGIMAVCSADMPIHETKENVTSPAGERIFILDRVRDPGNLGTIMRSAYAFGGVRLFLAGCADIYNPKTVRASMGAVFHVRTAEFADTLSAVKYVKSMGYRTVAAALDESAEKLGDEKPGLADAVVIGTEGEGLPDDVIAACDKKLYIPMSGGESLNCAVATSVIMWEFQKNINILYD